MLCCRHAGSGGGYWLCTSSWKTKINLPLPPLLLLLLLLHWHLWENCVLSAATVGKTAKILEKGAREGVRAQQDFSQTKPFFTFNVYWGIKSRGMEGRCRYQGGFEIHGLVNLQGRRVRSRLSSLTSCCACGKLTFHLSDSGYQLQRQQTPRIAILHQQAAECPLEAVVAIVKWLIRLR